MDRNNKHYVKTLLEMNMYRFRQVTEMVMNRFRHTTLKGKRQIYILVLQLDDSNDVQIYDPHYRL